MPAAQDYALTGKEQPDRMDVLIGGGVITSTANGAQKVAVATGCVSPALPTGIRTAKISILGLKGESGSQ
jgi:hypothetical protein